MPLTAEDKQKIKDIQTDFLREIEVFRNLLDIKILDEEKKQTFLSMIDRCEENLAKIKDIVETIED